MPSSSSGPITFHRGSFDAWILDVNLGGDYMEVWLKSEGARAPVSYLSKT